MYRKSLGWICVVMVSFILVVGCNKDDDSSIINTTGGINDADAADAYLLTVYNTMTTRSLFDDGFIFMPLLFSDDAVYTGSENIHWKASSDFDLTEDNSVLNTLFTDFYSISASLNVLFNELDTTEDVSLTEDVKASLVGEARAIRGMVYFYLNNYWGEVPILLDPDGNQVDSIVVAASSQEIFDQIEGDLLYGAENISKNSLNTGNRRMNEWSAKAFLARLYLYNGDWAKALEYAEDVIDNSGASLETILNNIYDINSSEHIWVLPENRANLSLAVWFLQPFASGQHVVEPRNNDFFEAGDLRKGVALSGPGTTIIKYDDAFDNSDPVYLVRLAEMYLIAAEAAARSTADFQTAEDYINALRSRANLEDVELNSGNFEGIILQERRVELCYEGAHRWLDLKRLNKDVDVLGSYGYTATDQLWPFTTTFLEAWPLLEQNEGY